MGKAEQGDTVNVHYTGRLGDGTIFDTSVGNEPLCFTIGKSEVIPDFEQAVVGMSPGESKTIQVPAEKAYGAHRAEMMLVVERSKFPAGFEPEVGQHLQIRHDDGNMLFVTVAEVSESNVILDANHPLAGKDLTFDMQLVGIG